MNLERKPTMTVGLSSQRASNKELPSIWWRHRGVAMFFQVCLLSRFPPSKRHRLRITDLLFGDSTVLPRDSSSHSTTSAKRLSCHNVIMTSSWFSNMLFMFSFQEKTPAPFFWSFSGKATDRWIALTIIHQCGTSSLHHVTMAFEIARIYTWYTLPALCEGDPAVTGGFPHQCPVAMPSSLWSCSVLFVLLSMTPSWYRQCFLVYWVCYFPCRRRHRPSRDGLLWLAPDLRLLDPSHLHIPSVALCLHEGKSIKLINARRTDRGKHRTLYLLFISYFQTAMAQ